MPSFKRSLAGQKIVWRGQAAESSDTLSIVRIYTDCAAEGGKAKPTDTRHYVLHRNTDWVAGPTADENGHDQTVLKAFVAYVESEWGSALPQSVNRRRGS